MSLPVLLAKNEERMPFRGTKIGELKMVRIEVTDPKRIERLLAANASNVTVETDDDSYTFHVHTPDDARQLCDYFDVAVTNRGRLPIKRLQEAIEAHGHTLDMTDYAPNVQALPGHYTVSLLEQDGSNVYPRRGVVTSDQVRENYPGRGRRSETDIADTAMRIYGWNSYIRDSLLVEKEG